MNRDQERRSEQNFTNEDIAMWQSNRSTPMGNSISNNEIDREKK